MAGTPDRALELLRSVWEPARSLALREAADMQHMAEAEGDRFGLAPWDWRFYAERVRKERYDFDAAAVKPYMPLDSVIEAAFAGHVQLGGARTHRSEPAPSCAAAERHDPGADESRTRETVS